MGISRACPNPASSRGYNDDAPIVGAVVRLVKLIHKDILIAAVNWLIITFG